MIYPTSVGICRSNALFASWAWYASTNSVTLRCIAEGVVSLSRCSSNGPVYPAKQGTSQCPQRAWSTTRTMVNSGATVKYHGHFQRHRSRRCARPNASLRMCVTYTTERVKGLFPLQRRSVAPYRFVPFPSDSLVWTQWPYCIPTLGWWTIGYAATALRWKHSHGNLHQLRTITIMTLATINMTMMTQAGNVSAGTFQCKTPCSKYA